MLMLDAEAGKKVRLKCGCVATVFTEEDYTNKPAFPMPEDDGKEAWVWVKLLGPEICKHHRKRFYIPVDPDENVETVNA